MSVIQSLLQRLQTRGVPAGVTIELSSACHLHCRHCYVTRGRKNVLSHALVLKLLDELADAGSFFVGFTGGEIALRGDLFRIIEAARERHFAVRLLTSGTLWGPGHWSRLSRLGVDEVRISIYAAEAAVHDRVTGVRGSHAAAVSTAMALRQRGVRVAFACPVLRSNAQRLTDLVAWSRSLDLPLALDPRITWTDQGAARPAHERPTARQLAKIAGNEEVGALLFPADDACAPWDCADSPCRVGRGSAYVQCNGEVRPCANWPVSAGNLLQQPLLEIWRASPVFVAARAIRNADLTACMRCAVQRFCRPCVAINLQEHRRIDRPAEIACALARARCHMKSLPKPQSG